MSKAAELAIRAAFIGIGATGVVDLWSMALKGLCGIPPLNFRMVGRWLGHLSRGRFTHENIANAAAIRGELAIGWIAHYLIGVVFAGGLLAIMGLDWAHRPTPMSALVFGIATVLAPFFVMQPGMGAGIAAAKTPNPSVARLRSLATHAVFGMGMYLSAVLAGLLLPP